MSYLYQAIVTPDEEGFSVEAPDTPGCFAQGHSRGSGEHGSRCDENIYCFVAVGR